VDEPTLNPDVAQCGLPDATVRKRVRPVLQLAASGGLVLLEIYASIQGESTHAGQCCTFVRTTACHLRCRDCDTPHAFSEGRLWTVDAILAEVARLDVPLVELTGGEPLLQQGVFALMRTLCDRGYRVLLETSGSLDIAAVDPRVHRIVDFKPPSTGELAHNRLGIIDALRAHDEVKLVLRDRADYEWARALVREHDLAARCPVLMGVIFGALPAADLAAWILEDRLPVRLQVQLHKVLWDPAARGV
jgi:7-carboxy-7-deazaguanine synthase